jgi:hypothetical protein
LISQILAVTINLTETKSTDAEALKRFQIECNIPNLKNGESVAWMKDNQLFLPAINRDIRFSAKGRTITFDPLLEEDSGTYTCISQTNGAQVSQRVNVYRPIYPGKFHSSVFHMNCWVCFANFSLICISYNLENIDSL